MTQTLSSLFVALGEQFAQERNDLEKDRKKLQDERDKFEAEKLATDKKLEQEGKDLEKDRAKLQNEREIFEAEKSTVMKTLDPERIRKQTDLEKNCRKLRDGWETIETKTTSLGDFLEINAGGEAFAVERSTLMMAPEASILRSLLGGCREETFSRDGQGRVFLDVTPCVFRVVLSYLRELRMDPEARKRTRLMTQPEFQGELEAVCKYFDVFEPLHEIESEQIKMKACYDGLEINDGNVVAYKTIGNWYGLPAISIEKIKADSYWKGRIVTLKEKHLVFLGIIATDSPTESLSYDYTRFGWAGKGSIIQNGTYNEYEEWGGWVAGDEAIFKLEQTHLKMYHKRLQKVFTLGPIPDSKEGLRRIYLDLYFQGDRVEISIPSDEEMRLIN